MKNEEKDRVLDAYRYHNANILRACGEVGVSRECFYLWSRQPAFAKKLQKIKDSMVAELESLAIARSFEGSDSLIKFLLTKLRPEKYGDKLDVKLDEESLRAIFECLPPEFRKEAHKELGRFLSKPNAE